MQSINSWNLGFLLTLQIAWFSPIPATNVILNAYGGKYTDVNIIVYYVNLAIQGLFSMLIAWKGLKKSDSPQKQITNRVTIFIINA